MFGTPPRLGRRTRSGSTPSCRCLKAIRRRPARIRASRPSALGECRTPCRNLWPGTGGPTCCETAPSSGASGSTPETPSRPHPRSQSTRRILPGPAAAAWRSDESISVLQLQWRPAGDSTPDRACPDPQETPTWTMPSSAPVAPGTAGYLETGLRSTPGSAP